MSSPLGCVAHLDAKFQKLGADLVGLLTSNPAWDDGNYGPVFVRLAWHSSGTFNPATGIGGSNGATMRFEPEKSAGANAGLDLPRKVLEEFMAKHPEHAFCSISDLWILASYVFLETSNGPSIKFHPGRKDAQSGEKEKVPPDGFLPDAEQGKLGADLKTNFEEEKKECVSHIRKIFGRNKFSDREMACLIIGGHAYGRCHTDRSGFAGKWIANPVKWGGKQYCTSLLDDEMWRIVDGSNPDAGCKASSDKVTGVCPVKGNKQYVDKRNTKMMLFTDMALVWDPEFKKAVETYGKDDNLLKQDFGLVFKRLTELGCSGFPPVAKADVHVPTVSKL